MRGFDGGIVIGFYGDVYLIHSTTLTILFVFWEAINEHTVDG